MGVVLIGAPGSGKSSTGKIIADLTSWRFLDSDLEIERKEGKTVQELFAGLGEPTFRSMERDFLVELVSKADTSRLVLSTGGGMSVPEANWALLCEIGPVVYLEADIETLFARLQGTKDRPLLSRNPKASLGKLMSEREAVYLRAGFKVKTDGKSPHEVACEIVNLLRLGGCNPERKG